MEDKIIAAARDYINELFKNNSDGHDANHSIRVYQNARMIAKAYPETNMTVISLASLLHDADDHKLFHTKNNENARAFLNSQQIEPDTAAFICQVIDGVSAPRAWKAKSYRMPTG